jgi:cell division protein FtsL
MNAKGELLEEVDSLFIPFKKLDFKYYLFVLLTIALFAIFAFPKIYIQQQIYFKSREISKLQAEYDTLKEENKIISASVEKIKFKNQILDTLF